MRAVSLAKAGIELVAVSEAQGLRYGRDPFRIPGEVERRRSRRRGRRGTLCRRVRLGQLTHQLPQTRQCKPSRTRLTGLPAVNRDRGDPQAFGELDLCEAHVLPDAPHALARIQRCRTEVSSRLCHGRQFRPPHGQSQANLSNDKFGRDSEVFEAVFGGRGRQADDLDRPSGYSPRSLSSRAAATPRTLAPSGYDSRPA